MLTALVALMIGMWAGLLRLGWQMPVQDFAAAHGALMICGFMGTLISLERAIALRPLLKHDLPYLVPLLAAVGAVSLMVGFSPAPLFMTGSSLGLVLIFVFIVYYQPAFYTVVMALGALSWLVGNGLWLAGSAFYEIVPWWIGFLVLTIAGERLELSRVMRVSKTVQRIFMLAVGVLLAGILMTRVDYAAGLRLTGAGEIFVAVWLLRYDIARRTLRQTGLTRFIAVCLFIGYLWLGISGGMAVYYGGVKAGFIYDAVLHTVFLGFAFSMIFGHAPMIFPSILGIPVNYRSEFYLHLGLLHGSLLLRVVGDVLTWQTAREWGGLLNVAVLLLFLVNTALSLVKPRAVLKLAYVLPLLVMGLIIGYSKDNALPEQAALSPMAAAGETAYQSSCSGCHGLDARGIVGLGKNLVDSPFVQSLSDEELHQFIVTGRPIWDAANTTGVEMPPRGGNPALSDTDIDRIIAYLRGLSESPG